MRKYKVLYALNNARIAGTERHLLFLLGNLNKELFDATVVCFTEGPLIGLLNSQGITALSLKRQRFVDFSMAKKLYRLINENQFDLIHSHCGQFACVIGRIAGVPYTIETRHGLYLIYDELDNIGMIKYLVNRSKATFVDLTLTVTQFDKKLLHEKFDVPNKKVRFVGNGVDVAELQGIESNTANVRKMLGIQPNVPIVGTVARFAEYKGLEYFIESMKFIKNEMPNIKFIIVGDGELKEALVGLAKQIGIFRDVIFTGYRADAISLMSIFNVFVLPSLLEGMPYTILEAMALKIPVVATDVFGNRELVVDGQSGYLVPPRNSFALAKAVIRLLQNKDEAAKMAENGFQRVVKFFSAKKMAENIEQLYLELLNGKRNSQRRKA